MTHYLKIMVVNLINLVFEHFFMESDHYICLWNLLLLQLTEIMCMNVLLQLALVFWPMVLTITISVRDSYDRHLLYIPSWTGECPENYSFIVIKDNNDNLTIINSKSEKIILKAVHFLMNTVGGLDTSAVIIARKELYQEERVIYCC